MSLHSAHGYSRAFPITNNSGMNPQLPRSIQGALNPVLELLKYLLFIFMKILLKCRLWSREVGEGPETAFPSSSWVKPHGWSDSHTLSEILLECPALCFLNCLVPVTIKQISILPCMDSSQVCWQQCFKGSSPNAAVISGVAKRPQKRRAGPGPCSSRA